MFVKCWIQEDKLTAVTCAAQSHEVFIQMDKIWLTMILNVSKNIYWKGLPIFFFLIRSHHKEANIKIKSKICNKLLILSTSFKTIGVTLNIKEQDNHVF